VESGRRKRKSAIQLQAKLSKGVIFMSAPSRRPEIRRRRTRREKISRLKKRLAAASADADRKRITDKLHKLGLVSPGNPVVK
jgi:hypothetical protein